MIKRRDSFTLAESRIAYTVYRKKEPDSQNPKVRIQNNPLRRIILLHGAGVAGELTWTFIANYLQHWDEILVPDLLGMGDSYFESSDQLGFSIENICDSLFSLLRHLHWQEFDLVGYSLGGLVALELNREAKAERDKNLAPDFKVLTMGLIEPALFSDQSLQAAITFRQAFVPLAANIKANPENDQHFFDFLNLVSPNRKGNKQMDKLAIQRLQVRPLGFANALAAVSDYAERLDENTLYRLIKSIPKGLGIVGGLSSPDLLHAQEKIQQHQPHWQIESLRGADHSLVYVRPKVIAQLINQHLV